MWGIKSIKGFAFVAGVLLVAVFGLFLVASVFAQSATEKVEATESNAIIKEYNVNGIVNEIETIHCKMTDRQMKALKLSADDIKRAREFCAKPTKEKVSFLAAEFKKVKQSTGLQSKITGYDNSYSCYYSGLNTGIPTYGDMGLSSSSCIWHDAGGSTSSCRVQGGVACLWGCTNVDPLIGWHTKTFQNKTALENEIKPKGYLAKQSDYPNSYTRSLPYGYRYEIAGPNPIVWPSTWHVEGPEPDPTFNWYAFLRGWYPVEVGVWHIIC